MLHLINCFLLAFAPHVVIYKATRLSEENGFRACVLAALGYAATQIVKIFVMASVLPTSGDDVTREFNLLEEVAKSVITLVVSVIGVQTTLQLIPNLSKFSAGTRVLAVALGMALGDSLLNYALPIFWGARAAEFSWNNIEMGIASNINLIFHIAFVAAVWLRTRTDLNKAAAPIVYAIIAVSAVLPSIDNYLSIVLSVDAWSLMAFRAALAVVLLVLARATLGSYTSQRSTPAPAARKTQ